MIIILLIIVNDKINFVLFLLITAVISGYCDRDESLLISWLNT